MEWQMLIAGLAPPLFLIMCGLLFRIGLPRKVNWFAGYRTPMACKNQDTWAFAHRFVGGIWIVFGLAWVGLAAVAVILVDRDTFTPEHIALWTVLVILGSILISMIPTEIALRKKFDKNGELRR